MIAKTSTSRERAARALRRDPSALEAARKRWDKLPLSTGQVILSDMRGSEKHHFILVSKHFHFLGAASLEGIVWLRDEYKLIIQ